MYFLQKQRLMNLWVLVALLIIRGPVGMWKGEYWPTTVSMVVPSHRKPVFGLVGHIRVIEGDDESCGRPSATAMLAIVYDLRAG